MVESAVVDVCLFEEQVCCSGKWRSGARGNHVFIRRAGGRYRQVWCIVVWWGPVGTMCLLEERGVW